MMTVSTDLYVGDVAPQCVQWTVSASDLVSDMTAVTDATAHIIYPDGNGTQVSWSLTIESATESTIVVKRSLESTDLIYAGAYVSWVSLTTPEGTVNTTQVTFSVNGHG